MVRVYDLENEQDLKDINQEIMEDVELSNNYKTITFVTDANELIGMKVTEDADVLFDASQYPDGEELLKGWKQLVNDGKVKCKITETSDLMINMHFKAGNIVYFTSDDVGTFLLENVPNYDLVYGLPLEFKQDETFNKAIDVILEAKDGDGIDYGVLESKTPVSISTAGLINIPTKYKNYYYQAKTISQYLKAMPFMGSVPVDFVIGVMDKLVDLGVFEFSDAPRDEFVSWVKGKI